MALLKVNQAASILGLSPSRVRQLSRSGALASGKNSRGQLVFERKNLMNYKRSLHGLPEQQWEKIGYVRVDCDTESFDPQLQELSDAFGSLDKTFSDIGSNLNDTREGLLGLIEELEGSPLPKTLYVTDSNVLTRFGFLFLEKLCQHCHTDIEIINF